MNKTILLALGDFHFHMDSLAYEQMQWRSEYGWQAADRIGNHPQMQQTGSRRDEIELTGMLLPHFVIASNDRQLRQLAKDKAGSIERLREIAKQRKPHLLCANTDHSNNHGHWVIKSINTTSSHILAGGQARVVQFTITLNYFGTLAHG